MNVISTCDLLRKINVFVRTDIYRIEDLLCFYRLVCDLGMAEWIARSVWVQVVLGLNPARVHVTEWFRPFFTKTVSSVLWMSPARLRLNTNSINQPNTCALKGTKFKDIKNFCFNLHKILINVILINIFNRWTIDVKKVVLDF